MLSLQIPVLLIYQNPATAMLRSKLQNSDSWTGKRTKQRILHQQKKPIFICVTLLYFGIRARSRFEVSRAKEEASIEARKYSAVFHSPWKMWPWKSSNHYPEYKVRSENPATVLSIIYQYCFFLGGLLSSPQAKQFAKDYVQWLPPKAEWNDLFYFVRTCDLSESIF